MSIYSGFVYKPALRSPVKVRIWGLDAHGRPFSQSASTVKVNGHRVVLEGVTVLIKDKDVIGVSLNEKKARFRLIQLSPSDENGHRKAELEVVVPAPDDFWETGLEAESTQRRPAERRKSHRYRCTGFVSYSTPGHGIVVRAPISDISRDGCYAEIAMPYPVGTRLQVVVFVMGATVSVQAVVASSHPGVGMGIQFDEHGMIGKQELQQILAQLERGLFRNPTRHETSS